MGVWRGSGEIWRGSGTTTGLVELGCGSGEGLVGVWRGSGTRRFLPADVGIPCGLWIKNKSWRTFMTQPPWKMEPSLLLAHL